MNNVMRLNLDHMEISVVTDGTFWLDGGTMFGIVPKIIWEKLAPPDTQNRIELGLNCLLIRSQQTTTLIDAGIGRAFTPKQWEIYRFDERTDLIRNLAKRGVKPECVDRVILTHLHFDHCGWCTQEVEGRWSPTFPRARYIVQASQWEDAFHPSLLARGGYMADRLTPLKQFGLLYLVNEEIELGEGIVLIPTPAHAPGHQSVRITAGGITVFCPGDIIPTRHHLRLPYIMAYDRDPEGVVRSKSSIIQQALEGNWIIFFSHDPHTPLAQLSQKENGSVHALPLYT